jgi:hypothetical protein
MEHGQLLEGGPVTWGGDHPRGGDPLGIPGFRHRKPRRGKHRKGKGCLGAVASLVLLLSSAVGVGILLAGYLYLAAFVF